jgi:hypothetical protein
LTLPQAPAAKKGDHAQRGKAMAVFGRRVAPVPVRAVETPPLAKPQVDDRTIIVPEKAYASETPHDLVQAVVNFVNFALRQAYFNRDEIAQNAMRAFHVDYYLAQVKNGGHSQYAANSNMLEIILRDCQQGLEAMRHEAATLHHRFLVFSQAEPTRMERVLAGRGFGQIDPFMENLDKEFYALDKEQPLISANRDWLRSLPELKVVADADYIAVTDAFAASNTHAAARKAEQEQAAREADARDPLKQAMTYLCLMAPEPRRFIAWHQGHPGHDLGDGVKVVRFVVETDKGMCAAIFHPKVSLLFGDLLSTEPIAKVPTEFVTEHVERATGANLMDALRQ